MSTQPVVISCLARPGATFYEAWVCDGTISAGNNIHTATQREEAEEAAIAEWRDNQLLAARIRESYRERPFEREG